MKIFGAQEKLIGVVGTSSFSVKERVEKELDGLMSNFVFLAADMSTKDVYELLLRAVKSSRVPLLAKIALSNICEEIEVLNFGVDKGYIGEFELINMRQVTLRLINELSSSDKYLYKELYNKE